jgi:hypothetical protein
LYHLSYNVCDELSYVCKSFKCACPANGLIFIRINSISDELNSMSDRLNSIYDQFNISAHSVPPTPSPQITPTTSYLSKVKSKPTSFSLCCQPVDSSTIHGISPNISQSNVSSDKQPVPSSVYSEINASLHITFYKMLASNISCKTPSSNKITIIFSMSSVDEMQKYIDPYSEYEHLRKNSQTKMRLAFVKIKVKVQNRIANMLLATRVCPHHHKKSCVDCFDTFTYKDKELNQAIINYFCDPSYISHPTNFDFV